MLMLTDGSTLVGAMATLGRQALSGLQRKHERGQIPGNGDVATGPGLTLHSGLSVGFGGPCEGPANSCLSPPVLKALALGPQPLHTLFPPHVPPSPASS